MKRLSRLAPRNWIGLSLVLAGFILRLRQYLVNRSLWLDEAMLADNIVSRTFGRLTEWLDYDQQAPIGFLWLQKLSVTIFGNNEYALRLIPFAAGCLALVLMFVLSRRLSAFSGNTALALFAVSSAFVSYTSEAKQYIVDVTVAIGLLTAYLHYDERGWKPPDYFWSGVIGAAAVWFSHPAIFSLAGIGLLLFIKAIRQRSALGWTLLTGGLWLASFAAFYIFFLRRSVTADVLLDYWGSAFLPLSSDAPNWLAGVFNGFFVFSAGLETPLLLNGILALAGLAALARKRTSLAAALTLPCLLALLASAFHAYPFTGRMILFLAPALILLLAEGVETLSTIFSRPRWLAWTIRLILAASLLFGPLTLAYENFTTPKLREHIRPTMEYLRNHLKEDDLVYVYYWAEPAVRYYAPKYGFTMDDFIIGADHHDQPELYRPDLDRLRGHKRVWVLFSHVYERGNFNERDYILDYLNSTGKLEREFRVPGTSVYLYLYDLQ